MIKKNLAVLDYIPSLALAEEGVMCGDCSYGTLHKAPLYTEKSDSPICTFTCPRYDFEYQVPEYLPNSEYLKDCAFMLAPRFELTTKEDLEQYSEAYHKIAASLDKLLKYERDNNLADIAIESSGRSISFFKL